MEKPNSEKKGPLAKKRKKKEKVSFSFLGSSELLNFQIPTLNAISALVSHTHLHQQVCCQILSFTHWAYWLTILVDYSQALSEDH